MREEAFAVSSSEMKSRKGQNIRAVSVLRSQTAVWVEKNEQPALSQR